MDNWKQGSCQRLLPAEVTFKHSVRMDCTCATDREQGRESASEKDRRIVCFFEGQSVWVCSRGNETIYRPYTLCPEELRDAKVCPVFSAINTASAVCQLISNKLIRKAHIWTAPYVKSPFPLFCSKWFVSPACKWSRPAVLEVGSLCPLWHHKWHSTPIGGCSSPPSETTSSQKKKRTTKNQFHWEEGGRMQTAKPEEPISSPCAVCALEDRIEQCPHWTSGVIYTCSLPEALLRIRSSGSLKAVATKWQCACLKEMNDENCVVGRLDDGSSPHHAKLVANT